MSYIDSRQPLMPQQYQYIPGSDVIGIRPQVQSNGDEHSDISSEYDQKHPPLKRPRVFDDASSNNNINGQSVSSRAPTPHSVPVNRGTANIFFKTRFCAKFKMDACRNGENCNFAHGMHDLRQAPPNWQEITGANVCSEEDRLTGNWEDDQRIIHKMKLCKKFINGEECPYGDRCSFLHEFPSKFREYRENSREEMVRYRDNPRENSAISIGTSGPPPMGHGNNGAFVVAGDVNRSVINPGFDAARANTKPVYWKTRLCTKFETTGHCPFSDKCHFAHGLAELQVSSGEVGNAGPVLTKQPSLLPGNTSPRKSMNVYSSTEEGLGKRCFPKLNHKKLNTIYADWPDDLPVMQNSSNQIEG